MNNIKKTDGKKYLSKEGLQEKKIYMEDVRQGIIWSQILDKPRSKNPYFSGKRI